MESWRYCSRGTGQTQIWGYWGAQKLQSMMKFWWRHCGRRTSQGGRLGGGSWTLESHCARRATK
eukprot:1160989-Pelagomonas_calceolata.AAC.17